VTIPVLTAGERHVLDLIAAGHSNTEIATRLTLSPETVRNRVSSIFTKLRVRDRAEAIVRGRGAGLLVAAGHHRRPYCPEMPARHPPKVVVRRQS
jgi:DNA-binding NarL/FixJ family response regulator